MDAETVTEVVQAAGAVFPAGTMLVVVVLAVVAWSIRAIMGMVGGIPRAFNGR